MTLLQISISLIVFGLLIFVFVSMIDAPINLETNEGTGWFLAGIGSLLMILAGIVCFIVRLFQVMI